MWYHRMPLVETYTPIPRLPCHDVWFGRYRRNSAERLDSSVSCVPCYTSLVPFNKFCDLILQVDTIQYKYVSSALHMIQLPLPHISNQKKEIEQVSWSLLILKVVCLQEEFSLQS